jgi:hypothetical protein
MSRYIFMDHSTICKKSEMKWPTAFIPFRIFRILRETLAQVLQ